MVVGYRRRSPAGCGGRAVGDLPGLRRRMAHRPGPDPATGSWSLTTLGLRRGRRGSSSRRRASTPRTRTPAPRRRASTAGSSSGEGRPGWCGRSPLHQAGRISGGAEAIRGAGGGALGRGDPQGGRELPGVRRARAAARGAVAGSHRGAAARVSAELGLLDGAIAERIARAADAVAAGDHDDQFPIDVFQTGSRTSSNMNANEVIATLAGEEPTPTTTSTWARARTTCSRRPCTSPRSRISRHLLPALDRLAAALGDEGRGVRRRREGGSARHPWTPSR